MVCPHNERQKGDGCGGINHRVITKQRLARKGRDDRRDNTKGWQNQDVDLRVPEEPENMLEHDRVTTASRTEKTGTKVTISQQHGDGTREDRNGSDQEISRNQPGPHKHGHLHERHARWAHIEDRGDDIDRPHDR